MNLTQSERFAKRFSQKRRAEQRDNSSRRGYDREWERLRIKVIRETIQAGVGCHACGQLFDPIDLSFAHVDHIRRLADGGDHSRENLRVMHSRCHNRMTSQEEADNAWGFTTAANGNGFPIDDRHPFNAKR